MSKKLPHSNIEDKEEKKKSLNKGNLDSTSNEKIQLKLVTKSVTILKNTIKEITNFSIDAIPKEAIGLLSGREIRPKELIITKGYYVTKGEEYSVSFSENDFQFFDQLSDAEFCVGWWHSHPGLGLFLSQTDITTHIFSFQLVHPLSVALVVDPMNIQRDGIAKHQFFQVVGDSRNNSFKYREIASYLTLSSD